MKFVKKNGMKALGKLSKGVCFVPWKLFRRYNANLNQVEGQWGRQQTGECFIECVSISMCLHVHTTAHHYTNNIVLVFIHTVARETAEVLPFFGDEGETILSHRATLTNSNDGQAKKETDTEDPFSAAPLNHLFRFRKLLELHENQEIPCILCVVCRMQSAAACTPLKTPFICSLVSSYQHGVLF